ncbi:hypothetical protein ACWGPD_11190 [Streptomyces hirsutus]|uniref:hypothetical protein n=1 Tax=Streptomyces hirsutus TaxID=35620 RepID=UPI00363534D8
MAKMVTMDLEDFTSLVGLGAIASRRGMYLELYNLGRTKAGKFTSGGSDNVVISASNFDDRVDTTNQVIARAKAAIEAAAEPEAG